MANVRQASKRVVRLEKEAARLDYLRAIQDARDSGMSLAAIGAELGVSRQRIRQLLDRVGRPTR